MREKAREKVIGERRGEKGKVRERGEGREGGGKE
jgi:hypothetical protein